MKTRIIHTKIFCDEYYRGLSFAEKTVFMFYLFNEKVNLCSIYECPDFYTLAHNPGVSQKMLSQIKNKFLMDGKFVFLDNWVKLVNGNRYNDYAGPKNQGAIERELAEIPDNLKNFIYSIDTVSSTLDTPINQNQNHKSKSEIKNTEVYEKIANHFNESFNKHYKITGAWTANCDKWLKTYSLEDILTAIDNWKNNGWFVERGSEDISLLFRTRNKNGECDYIGQLLNSKKKKGNIIG